MPKDIINKGDKLIKDNFEKTQEVIKIVSDMELKNKRKGGKNA